MSDIALTVSVLALVAVVGLWIGNVKIRGVGFGIGGVLFGGIIVGRCGPGELSLLAARCCTSFRIWPDSLRVYHRHPGGTGVSSPLCASPGYGSISLHILIVILGGLVTAVLHKLSLISRCRWCANVSLVQSLIRQRWGRAANSARSGRTV